MSQDNSSKTVKEAKTIAIVGLSNDPQKDSFKVGLYMKQHGYRIIPVNPSVDKILGEKSYKSLLDVPIELQKNIDVVDIFRKAQDIPPIVEQAIQLKTKFGKPLTVWMQLGIINEVAAEAARRAGLIVVMNKCLMAEHKR